MNRYIILLRGINVSGKNKIGMSELKLGLIQEGFQNVKTLLNSGNIVLDTDLSREDTALSVAQFIVNAFHLDIPVLALGIDEVEDALAHAPNWWDLEDKSFYDNLIFVFPSTSSEEIYQRIGTPSEELEKVLVYKNVIFWSFVLGKHSKANWWKKTAMDGIREELTIRTANTTKKLLSLAKEKRDE